MVSNVQTSFVAGHFVYRAYIESIQVLRHSELCFSTAFCYFNPATEGHTETEKEPVIISSVQLFHGGRSSSFHSLSHHRPVFQAPPTTTTASNFPPPSRPPVTPLVPSPTASFGLLSCLNPMPHLRRRRRRRLGRVRVHSQVRLRPGILRYRQYAEAN